MVDVVVASAAMVVTVVFLAVVSVIVAIFKVSEDAPIFL